MSPKNIHSGENTFLWFSGLTSASFYCHFKQTELTEKIKCSFLTSQAHRWFQSCLQYICSSLELAGRSRWRRRSTQTTDQQLHASIAVGCSPEAGKSRRIVQRTKQQETTAPRSLRQTAGDQHVGRRSAATRYMGLAFNNYKITVLYSL